MRTLKARVIWIKSTFGGRDHPPVEGLRPRLFFQKHLAEPDCSSLTIGIQITRLEPLNDNWEGTVEFVPIPGAVLSDDCLTLGAPIEFLDGFRIIAVGVLL